MDNYKYRELLLRIEQENLRISDDDIPIDYEVYELDSGDTSAIITLKNFDTSCDFDMFFKYGHTLKITGTSPSFEGEQLILEGTVDDIDLNGSELNIWLNVTTSNVITEKTAEELQPVAYGYRNTESSSWNFLGANVEPPEDYKYMEPLYTLKQLHPRVKMTQSEFDEFNALNEQFTILGVLSYVWEHRDTEIGKLFLLKELQLAQLWSDYDRKHPEETIEIISDKKWFVRSKEKEQGYYLFLSSNNDVQERWYHTTRKDDTEFAISFDTEEEAKLWTSPLTEAVHLPVEDK